MSREVRRVPANWEHPKRDGKSIPLYETFPYNEEEIKEGLEDGWLTNEPPFYGCEVMPQWPEAERTHYQMYEQMYESTTEGTPISPVFETPEQLARWLADNNASAFADMPASYEQWLGMIGVGSNVGSAVQTSTGEVISGVAAASRG